MSALGDMMKRGSDEEERIEDKSIFLEVADGFKLSTLENMMKDGIVHFQYRKKPKKGQTVGEIRDAWGTKKMSVVSKIPHGGDCPPKRVGYTIYFDVEKADWRAFWGGNVIGAWDKVYTEEEFHKELAKELEEETPTE